MVEYVAVFYTELAAVRTLRAIRNAGFDARMAPVPRELSASCGSCVFFTAGAYDPGLADEDTQAVYSIGGTPKKPVYTLIAGAGGILE